VLENDFGMDSEFGDTSLLDFFNNKSGESENIDVDVNDHRDENLDHYSEIVINDLYNQCQLDSNDQGVHDDDYGDLIPTFHENLLNSQQLIDRQQMHDNNYDCQRLVDVENKRSEMRDQECNSCARPGKSRIPSPPPNVSTNDSPLLRSLLRAKRLSKIIVNSNKLIKKPRIETIVIEDTQQEIIEIPDTQPPTIIIPDSQPSTIIIHDTQPPTIVIPDTQPQIIEILDTQP
jgi:hypothetical protein